VLRSLYGLTPAEARLAQGLVNGLSLQEYAEQQSVSIHTVRSQFRTIATKAGVGRQTDFVRAVLTGPAMLRRADAAMAVP
jgi:DNA-binding CsgD family transcriptional regulator